MLGTPPAAYRLLSAVAVPAAAALIGYVHAHDAQDRAQAPARPPDIPSQGASLVRPSPGGGARSRGVGGLLPAGVAVLSARSRGAHPTHVRASLVLDALRRVARAAREPAV